MREEYNIEELNPKKKSIYEKVKRAINYTDKPHCDELLPKASGRAGSFFSNINQYVFT